MTGWRGTQGFSPLQTSTGDTEKLWQSAREGEPSLPCQAPLSWDGSGRARGQRAEQSRAGHTPHNRLRAAVPPPDETEIGTNTQTMPEHKLPVRKEERQKRTWILLQLNADCRPRSCLCSSPGSPSRAHFTPTNSFRYP